MPEAQPIDTALVQATVRPIAHVVYTRRAADGFLPTNGEFTDWKLDPSLRCDHVRWEIGPRIGYAKLTHIPHLRADGRDDRANEDALARHSLDDQVRIVAFSIDDELVDQGEEPQAGKTLFEGILDRHHPDWRGDARGADEGVRFTASALAGLDNQLPGHIVHGPWMTPPNAAPAVIEGLPCAINPRGRPNMVGVDTSASSFTWRGSLVAHPLWCPADQPDAAYWSVREALLAVIALWLHGPISAPLGQRHIDIEGASMAMLQTRTAPATVEPRWRGLWKQCPPLDLKGMGALDAIEAICRASGFRFAITPATIDEEAADRRMILRLWRRGGGRQTWLDLAKRGTTHASAEDALRDNNVSRVTVLHDASEAVAEITAHGKVWIEARVPLLPLWEPELIAGTTMGPDMMTEPEALLAGDGYHGRHVQGGSRFDQYGHVGRVWGVDCVGRTASGYPSASPYWHGGAPFDWVARLELDTDDFPETARRRKAGLPAIQWSNRIRHALPLRSSEARYRGSQYVLECSEDAGAHWVVVQPEFTSLSGEFGIRLNIRNLATVNIGALQTGKRPRRAQDSWWGLIQSAQLRFRLTCAIEADHRTLHVAQRRPTGCSSYPRSALLQTAGEVVWISPTSALQWANQSAWQPEYPEMHAPLGGFTWYLGSVADPADERRDSLEDARVSVAASTWLMHLDRFRLGDVVLGIRGRDHRFGSPAKDATGPNVVALDFRLAPAASQGIDLALEDDVLRGGTR